jgi:opacity protein-like surface antigen
MPHMDAPRARGGRALAGGPPRGWILLALTALSLLVARATCHGEDTDQPRFYWSLRLGVGNLLDLRPIQELEVEREALLTGMSVGVNLGRYFGVELAGDQFNTDFHIPGVGRVGEYGMFSLIPQVRIRYPLLDGLLTPYLIGGVGIGHNDFNDRKQKGEGLSIHASDTTMVGAIGAGIEYFIANNIALGVEARYLISRDQEIEIQGRTQKADLDAVLAAVSLRLLFPETPAALETEPTDYRTEGRFYLGFRLGGATPVNRDVADDLQARPPNNAIVGPLGPLYGVVLGTDLTRHLGVELAGEGFEPLLAIPHLGSVTEYAIYSVTPEVRLRYPFVGGRLAPYALAGVGVSWGEVNDIKPHGFDLNIKGHDYAPVGVVGLGADYFVARNIAVGIELKYMILRGHSITIAGVTQDMNLDSFLTFLGVRIFFGKGSGH